MKKNKAKNIARQLLPVLLLTAGLFIIHLALPVRLVFNRTNSLQADFFLLKEGKLPTKRGEYIAFKKDNPFYKYPFLKMALGFAGDKILESDYGYFLVSEDGGVFAGKTKQYSSTGMPLKALRSELTQSEELIIPEGKYYAYADHPDSLDSRYEQIGLVDQNQILGTATEFSNMDDLLLLLVFIILTPVLAEMFSQLIKKLDWQNNKRQIKYALLILLFIYLMISPLFAKDLGVRGQIFKIEEQDLRAKIDSRLNDLEASGELEEFNKQWVSDTKKQIKRPTSVSGIGKTKTPREFIHPPQILEHQITDYAGRVIAKAGTRINPLDYVNLREELLFIDGDDPEQVNWALDIYRSKPARIILIKGNIIDLMKREEIQIYFDQSGALVKKLKIKNVPARLFQDGEDLKIREEVL